MGGADGAAVVPLVAYRRNAWAKADLAWEQVSVVAAAFAAEAIAADAEPLLRRALELSGEFAGDDPRRAASLTSLADLRCAQGATDEAAGLFKAAFAAWARGEGWVRRLGVAAPGYPNAHCLYLVRDALADVTDLASGEHQRNWCGLEQWRLRHPEHPRDLRKLLGAVWLCRARRESGARVRRSS